ncbi:DoxX family protein [Paenibacillus sp. JX-17]|uniref:DoxX family protein n=1 Tax=Paenibacillus lacisoli TaxID=3064525 RepID=A0ABT9CB06_9BACL|nr:DoxX family protein [Paenibacillus sp. JX-17]MDO7906439.1 DoxX family protein [Paenibacillus sp. JX-17]
MIKTREIGILIVRVIAGLLFALHGWQKFQGGIGNTSGFFESIGLPGILAPVVAIIELAGGIALILGLGTRIAGLALAVIMAGVLLTAKSGAPIVGGMEYELLLLAAAVQLLLTGSSLLALDSLFSRSGRRKAAPAERSPV